MDYHFAHAEEVKKSAFRPRMSSKFLKTFLPVFLLSAILPILMMLVMERNQLNFTSRATQEQLRIWFEPSSIIASTGDLITLEVFALNDSENKSVYNVRTLIPSDSNFSVKPSELFYQEPFVGRVKLGTITVTPLKSGSFELAIPAESVTLNSSEVEVITSPAKIDVN